MKKNKQICSRHFYELLDCLADQFLYNKSATCTGEMLGKNISSNVKDCFSITIRPETLPSDILTIAVLSEKSSQTKLKEYIYTIFIDLSEIEGVLYKSFLSIVLAHQMCHFVSFYELFLKLDDNAKFAAHIITNTISNILADDMQGNDRYQNEVQEKIDNIDKHNIEDILKTMGDYSKEHFYMGNDTEIDYNKFFKDFIDHLCRVSKTCL
jgi:hypothetical protein